MSISRIAMCEKEKQPEECVREFLFLIMKTIKLAHPAQCLDILMAKEVKYGGTVKVCQGLRKGGRCYSGTISLRHEMT